MRFMPEATYHPGKGVLVTDALCQEALYRDPIEATWRTWVCMWALWPRHDHRLMRDWSSSGNARGKTSTWRYPCNTPSTERETSSQKETSSAHGTVSRWRMTASSFPFPRGKKSSHAFMTGILESRSVANVPDNQCGGQALAGLDIKERVDSCRHCIEKRPSQIREPLLPSTLPERPLQKVGVDICDFKNSQFPDWLILQIHWYRLPTWHDDSCCHRQDDELLRTAWSTGEVVVSVNGAQFSSSEFRALILQLRPRNAVSSTSHWSTQPPLPAEQRGSRDSGEDSGHLEARRHLLSPPHLPLNASTPRESAALLSWSWARTDSNSKHWFTTSFLRPLPYLVTP